MTHRIQNFDELARNKLRKDSLLIAEAGYESVEKHEAGANFHPL